MNAEDFLREWLECGAAIRSAPCAHDGHTVTVTLPGTGQWEGHGVTVLAAMESCDLAMAQELQFAGELRVAG